MEQYDEPEAPDEVGCTPTPCLHCYKPVQVDLIDLTNDILYISKTCKSSCLQELGDGEGDLENDAMDEDTAEVLDHQTQPSDRPRITTRYMTKYERARILGTRALQIRCIAHM